MKNIFIDEYIEYSKLEDEEVLSYIVKTFLALWYKPNEPLKDFKEWFSKRIKKYNS